VISLYRSLRHARAIRVREFSNKLLVRARRSTKVRKKVFMVAEGENAAPSARRCGAYSAFGAKMFSTGAILPRA
jgi:hypothetical protein